MVQQSYFSSSTPVARVSQLAIHLDRDVNDKGLVLDRHQHLNALWLTSDNGLNFDQWMSQQCGIDPSQIRASSAQLIRYSKSFSCWCRQFIDRIGTN